MAPASDTVAGLLAKPMRFLRALFNKKIVVIPAVVVILTATGYTVALRSLSENVDEAPSAASFSYLRVAGAPRQVLECALDPADVPGLEPASDGPRPNYLHTCGNRILDSRGREFQVVGITWSGMEYAGHSPLGLHVRNWQEVLDQIARLSYNTVRLPYTNDMLQPGVMPRFIDYELNPDLKGLSALEVLDRLVQGARQRGLRVILDRHRPTATAQTPLWYTMDVPEDKWIEDWRMLARRYLGNDTVVGADLHNEPHGDATWGSGDRATDWHLAAQRAGNAILDVNPYLLIFVQGVDRQGDSLYWWGGDLRGVIRHPVQLDVPNRVVYSPRDYGPEVYEQGYFSDPSFPRNLPGIWDQHWGYIHKQEIGPVVLGELGGTRLDDSTDGRWKRTLLEYLEANRIGYINWALDRSTFDDPEAFERDTRTTILDLGRLYRASLGIPDTQVEAKTNSAATSLKVLYRTTTPNDEATTIGFDVRIRNECTGAVDLTRVELRYWFTPGELDDRRQSTHASWASSSDGGLRSELVQARESGLQSSVRVSFDPSAGRIGPLSETDDIHVEVHKSDGSKYVQTNDYSYSPNVEYEEQSRVTLYLDGQLIWGIEP